jgi:nucleoside-diphosphate-sugar epimerase
VRILVIGGTGFVGAPLLRSLWDGGHDVTVFHRGKTEPQLPADVKHVHSPDAAFPITRFPSELKADWDAVIHVLLTNAVETKAAVKFFRGRAGRFVVVSSADTYAAYGRLIGIEPETTSVPATQTEEAPVRSQLYPYGREANGPWGKMHDYDKILVERAAQCDAQLPATILRLPMVFGPGDKQRRFARFLQRMIDGRPSIFISESEARWRATHDYVDNVAAGIAHAAVHPDGAHQTFNIGEAATPTMRERLEDFARVADWRGAIEVLSDEETPAPLRPPVPLPSNLVLDTSRIRLKLAFATPVPYDTRLRRTLEWERLQPRMNIDYGSEDRLAAAG